MGFADLTMTYRADITPLRDAGVVQFRLLQGDEPLLWSDVIHRWQNNDRFRRFFGSLLVDAPFPAYFWETPPVTRARIGREFEFVLVDAPQLVDVRADERAFAEHFASAQTGTSVVECSNLGGDASLIVPCPLGALSTYSQISTFARQAPVDQQHQLWTLVGATLERQLGPNPVWLSTSGLGIFWLHIRLDSVPKYYTHPPYRTA